MALIEGTCSHMCQKAGWGLNYVGQYPERGILLVIPSSGTFLASRRLVNGNNNVFNGDTDRARPTG